MGTRDREVWQIVVAAEREHGDRAEAHVRRISDLAAALGEMERACLFADAADALHILHSINGADGTTPLSPKGKGARNGRGKTGPSDSEESLLPRVRPRARTTKLPPDRLQ